MQTKHRIIAAVALTLAGAGLPLFAEPTHAPAHAAEHAKPAEPSKPADQAPADHLPAAHGDAKPAEKPASVAPDAAVKMLIDGNDRFVAKAMNRPHQDQARLCETFAGGQHPFAAVLSCADSRVPPELIFDSGIGDLFVVRVAGNVAATDEIGTLEYGIEHLGINAVLVMGHLKCGAVTAVIDKAEVSPNIAKLVAPISPAADKARKDFPLLAGPRLVDKAIRQNVFQAIADLQGKSDLIRERVKSGKLKIVGGVYNLHTGEVDWLESGPAVEKTNNDEAGKKPGGELIHEKPGEAHEKPHGGTSKEAGPHASADTTTPAKPGEAKKDNYLILGGLVGGGAAVSYGIIHFMRRG